MGGTRPPPVHPVALPLYLYSLALTSMSLYKHPLIEIYILKDRAYHLYTSNFHHKYIEHDYTTCWTKIWSELRPSKKRVTVIMRVGSYAILVCHCIQCFPSTIH